MKMGTFFRKVPIFVFAALPVPAPVPLAGRSALAGLVCRQLSDKQNRTKSKNTPDSNCEKQNHSQPSPDERRQF